MSPIASGYGSQGGGAAREGLPSGRWYASARRARAPFRAGRGRDGLAMYLTQLRYFQTIASCGSMTAAAKMLRVSQPTLTVAIRHLEERLGTTLLFRERLGVSLHEFRLDYREDRRNQRDSRQPVRQHQQPKQHCHFR